MVGSHLAGRRSPHLQYGPDGRPRPPVRRPPHPSPGGPGEGGVPRAHHSCQATSPHLSPFLPAGQPESWKCSVGRPADASSKGFFVHHFRVTQAAPCLLPNCGGQGPGTRSRSPRAPLHSGFLPNGSVIDIPKSFLKNHKYYI